jgi:hypothetical protein
MNSYFEYGKSENPQLPSNQRRVNTFNFEELPINYSCRLGVGIKLLKTYAHCAIYSICLLNITLKTFL